MKTFVVLGMHRSATSLVAKGLADNIYMGDDMMGSDVSNPQGHWENKRFWRLNDEILKAAGGSWDRPPSEEAIVAQRDKFAGKVESLVRREQKDLWGWKDPRTTLTIKLYLPYLVNPHWVCCFRDPMEVARSLQRRDGFALVKGLTLARVYNDRLLSFLQGATQC